MTEEFLELVGAGERRWPTAYDMVISRACPGCDARKMQMCVNPITGRARKAPCLIRETQGWTDVA